MEGIKQPITCPLHPSENFHRVDPRPTTQKKLYCYECVLESPDPKSLSTILLSFEKFVKVASLHYVTQRNKINPNSNPPAEFVEILSRQGESLEKLTKHLNEEKNKVEELFEEITKIVIAKINQKRNEYLEKLDEFLFSACQQYTSYEKLLKRNYPKPEDVEFLCPSKAELEKRLGKVSNALQLNSFVTGIIQDLNPDAPQKEMEEEEKRKYFTKLIENLKAIELTYPSVEIKVIDLYSIESGIKENLDKTLEKVLSISGAIRNLIPAINIYPQSSIIGPDDFKTIREWLPEKYEFAPKLIYRGSRDGMNGGEAFHKNCDNKGPTISLINCKFEGSMKSSIIGGFLDKSWHSNNAYIASSEAFIFSLTAKIKCPILEKDTKNAAYGQNVCGPVFGSNCILVYSQGSYCQPLCYLNSGSIIETPSFTGANKINYVCEEIEVYTLT